MSLAIGVYFSYIELIIIGVIIEAACEEFSTSSSECIFLDSIDLNHRPHWIGKKGKMVMEPNTEKGPRMGCPLMG